jgi:hypothetical protein
LAVLNQNPVTAPADAGAMFLQAGQHRLIAIIHDGSAVPDHVSGAGIVLALRGLRGSRRSNGKRGKGDNGKKRNKPDHYFSPQKRIPDRDRIPYIASVNAFASRTDQRPRRKSRAALGGR